MVQSSNEAVLLNRYTGTKRTIPEYAETSPRPASPALGIISGLKETFRKRYIAQRTNKAELRPQKQSEKTESCLENLWNENTVERATETEIDLRRE